MARARNTAQWPTQRAAHASTACYRVLVGIVDVWGANGRTQAAEESRGLGLERRQHWLKSVRGVVRWWTLEIKPQLHNCGRQVNARSDELMRGLPAITIPDGACT